MVIAFITLLNVTRYTFIFGEYKQQKQLSLKYDGTTPIREPNLRYLHIENSFSFFSWKIISVLVPFPSVRTGAKPVSFLGQAPLWRVSWQSKHDKLIYKKRKYDLVVNRTLTKSGQLLAVIFCSRFPSAVSFQEHNSPARELARAYNNSFHAQFSQKNARNRHTEFSILLQGLFTDYNSPNRGSEWAAWAIF